MILDFGIKKIQPNHDMHFFYNAPDFYHDVIEKINQAKFFVLLETYIFHPDKVGNQFFEALIKASRRGVKVNLVLDKLGSNLITQKIQQDLKKEGVYLHFFGKLRVSKFLRRQFFIGRRLHHKVIIIDNKDAYVGGINIGEEFLNWFDFAVRINGPSVNDLYRICYRYLPKTAKKALKKISIHNSDQGTILARVISNDSLLEVKGINQQLKSYLKDATQEVIIISAYLFPSKRFRKMIYSLAQKGVKVVLFCNHREDVPLITLATQYYYHSFLKSGVEIYEWMPNVLHGKAFIIDGKILSLGSYNFNYMSYFTNIELNLEIYDRSKIREFESEVLNLMEGNVHGVTLDNLDQRILKKFQRWLAYLIVRIVSVISVIIIRNTSKVSLDDI
jgi:cardiolipin synthase